MLKSSDFSTDDLKLRSYDFARPFGIPVRYHDMHDLIKRINVPFVEFHLSANDMHLDLDKVLDKTYPQITAAVHCPELFDKDHILDLASSCRVYRDQSIDNVKRTIEICHKIRQKFNNTENIKLVINVGGWDSNGFISESDVKKKYDLVASSLTSLNLNGIELCIQTMPPFPWHFGGQSFHNLFVSPSEIESFMRRGIDNVSLCFDVSHTLMAANYFGFDFYESLQKLGSYITHLHISDAEGSSGEGVQFGQGALDVSKLCDCLNAHCPDASFIPEVWQGHHDNGAGFWKALDALNRKL